MPTLNISSLGTDVTGGVSRLFGKPGGSGSGSSTSEATPQVPVEQLISPPTQTRRRTRRNTILNGGDGLQ